MKTSRIFPHIALALSTTIMPLPLKKEDSHLHRCTYNGVVVMPLIEGLLLEGAKSEDAGTSTFCSLLLHVSLLSSSFSFPFLPFSHYLAIAWIIAWIAGAWVR